MKTPAVVVPGKPCALAAEVIEGLVEQGAHPRLGLLRAPVPGALLADGDPAAGAAQ